MSIINSFVLVLLLTAFLTIILIRVLKNDFSHFLEVSEEDIGDEEESGWKYIYADVFRTPPHMSVLAAMVGSGVHIAATVSILLACVLCEWVSVTKKGSILTALIVIYCLCSAIGGYVSSKLYKQLKFVPIFILS